MTETVLERLAELVRADGGLLAAAVMSPPQDEPALAQLVARGPRAGGHAADLPLVVESVYEGYLLHHGAPRVVDGGDRDFALLAGDRLFAAGLERLAEAGDLHSVRALADVIALSAAAHARDDVGLAEAVWDAGATEVGWGPDPSVDAAKMATLKGDPHARQNLLDAAANVRSQSVAEPA